MSNGRWVMGNRQKCLLLQNIHLANLIFNLNRGLAQKFITTKYTLLNFKKKQPTIFCLLFLKFLFIFLKFKAS